MFSKSLAPGIQAVIIFERVFKGSNYLRNMTHIFHLHFLKIAPQLIPKVSKCLYVQSSELHFEKKLKWKIHIPLTHIPATCSQAGAAADLAQLLKCREYSSLLKDNAFAAFGVETLGPWLADMKSFIKALPSRLVDGSGDPRANKEMRSASWEPCRKQTS